MEVKPCIIVCVCVCVCVCVRAVCVCVCVCVCECLCIIPLQTVDVLVKYNLLIADVAPKRDGAGS